MSIITQPITVSPDILSGVPVFTGTRVPVKNLFDYLEAGDSLERVMNSTIEKCRFFVILN